MITITNFKRVSTKALPYLVILFIITFIVGLYSALIASPSDYQQKEYVRIMYVHVPAAWLSLGIYSLIAICSFSSIVWKTKISYLISISAAPIGLCFTGITLITGSLWGYPIWGTYWQWEPRLTSTLILFLFYLCYIIIVNADSNILRAEKPAAVIALIGFINVPIVKFSVRIWNSLHQPDSILTSSGPQIDKSMLLPLLLMFISYALYFIINMIIRFNTILIKIKYDIRSY